MLLQLSIISMTRGRIGSKASSQVEGSASWPTVVGDPCSASATAFSIASAMAFAVGSTASMFGEHAQALRRLDRVGVRDRA